MVYRLFLSAVITVLLLSGPLTIRAAPYQDFPQVPSGKATYAGANDRYVTDRMLVKYRRKVTDLEMDDSAARHGLGNIERFDRNRFVSRFDPKGRLTHWRVVGLPAGADFNAVRVQLTDDPAVEYAEPDYLLHTVTIPNDSRFNSQWALNNTGQSGGTIDADIDAPEAWEIATGNKNIIVAIVDSGSDVSHSDLAANIWVNTGEIAGNGIDDDGNGYVDDVNGYDFANNDADPFDDTEHGAEVSGIIGAVGNNGIGVAGVNWNASMMVLKFISASGSGLTSNAVYAINYAVANGARVINASWGADTYSQFLHDAIAAANDAGVLFVAAAGNGGTDRVGDDNDALPFYPASYALPNIISVAATDRNDQLPGFSNYGVTSVDLGAPGVNIISTMTANRYATGSGTSFAAPQVSGAATLVWSHYPSLDAAGVKNRLLANTDPIPSLVGKTVTGGRLNLARAIEEDLTPPAPIADLQVTAVGGHAVSLRWGASGDNGLAGSAYRYDLRYSTAPIDDTNFDAATGVGEIAASAPPGGTEIYKATGLEAATVYYFAVEAIDDVGNRGALSNVASAHTLQPAIVFSDDFESGAPGWTTVDDIYSSKSGLWHLSNHRYGSPNTAFYYGQESSLNYDTGGVGNAGSLISAPIDLSGYVESSLRYSQFLQTENLPPYDTARVYVTDDGGATWAELYANALSTPAAPLPGGLVTETIDLSAYDGKVVQLRFAFDTVNGANNSFEGWVVDDVEVSATPYVDSDGDGRSDNADNCVLIPNGAQHDSNYDGYGNACDADLNDDLIVNTIDFGLFREVYGQTGANLDADFNADGIVNTLDFGRFRLMYGNHPGPSGLVP